MKLGNQLVTRHGEQLEEKSLTICSGTDYINIAYQHVICPSAEIAKVRKLCLFTLIASPRVCIGEWNAEESSFVDLSYQTQITFNTTDGRRHKIIINRSILITHQTILIDSSKGKRTRKVSSFVRNV